MNELFMNKSPFFDMIEKKEVFSMEELSKWTEYIEDVRQTSKVRHKLKDSLVIVLFATLADGKNFSSEMKEKF